MKLTHPEAPGVEIEPKAEHVDTYKTQGWVEAETKKSTGKGK